MTRPASATMATTSKAELDEMPAGVTLPTAFVAAHSISRSHVVNPAKGEVVEKSGSGVDLTSCPPPWSCLVSRLSVLPCRRRPKCNTRRKPDGGNMWQMVAGERSATWMALIDDKCLSVAEQQYGNALQVGC